MITDKRFLPGPSPRGQRKNDHFPSPKINERIRKPSDQVKSDPAAKSIHFHELIHGKNILITLRGRRAARFDGFYDGLTFSNRPLIINEVITLKVTGVDKFKLGCLSIGLTTDDPDRYKSCQLPTAPELIKRIGTRFTELDERFCQANVQLNLRLSDRGELILIVEDNKQYQKVLIDNVDTGKPQWLLVDIFGRCTTLELEPFRPKPTPEPEGKKPEAKVKPFPNQRQQSVAATMQIGDYEYVEEPSNRLGQGTFGEVWKGMRNRDGLDVALKKLPFDPDQDLAELHVMETVSHPNLLKLLFTHRKGPYLYVITELCSMDLERFLKNFLVDRRLNVTNLQVLSKQLASGYIVLHAAEIIHRDIKPQNILMNISNNSAMAKIADFGCGKFMEGQLYANTVAGTVLYMAPELGACWANKASYSHYDARADVWSLGLVLYECALGHLPYDQKTLLEFFVAMGKSQSKAKKMKPKIPSNVDPTMKELLSKMLKPLYKDRMVPTDFFQSSFHSHVRLTSRIIY